MMHKRIASCFLVVTLVLAGAFFLERRDKPTITEAQVEMIQIGMSLNDVEAILGCPPDNYTCMEDEDYLPIQLVALSRGHPGLSSWQPYPSR